MPKPCLLPRQEKKGLVGLKTDKPYTNCQQMGGHVMSYVDKQGCKDKFLNDGRIPY